jgi:CBS domain-containing protein
MQVQQILKAKPGTPGSVETIRPGTSVADAARLMSERRIGAVVVSPDGATVAGILSERDIVRELGRRGPGCLSDLVDQLMTTAIVTCGPEDTADQVLSRMTQGRFRHLPVVVDGQMVGLISIGDVVKARLDELAMEKEALTGMIMGY